MTTVAIEIADAGLNAAGEAGPIGAPSAGFALLDRGGVVVGEDARAASRLKPRHVNHRFWEHLDRGSVGRPFPRGLTHADLVFAHLSEYWTGLRRALSLSLPSTSVLLAVPGCYSPSQLSLLLGIARACDMPVTGLVDASLAALDGEPGNGFTLHLDVYLHRAVWTRVETGSRRTRTEVESVESVGLLSVRDAVVELLSDQFVRETRFDPLHAARSEQALYDALPEWLEQIEHGDSAVLALEDRGQTRSIEVDRGRLRAATGDRLEPILEAGRGLLGTDSPGSVALSSRAAGIPGLRERIGELAGAVPRILAEGAAAGGALRHRDLLGQPGAELPLALGLPIRERHG